MPPTLRPENCASTTANLKILSSKIAAATHREFPPWNFQTRVVKTLEIGCDARLIDAEVIDPHLRLAAPTTMRQRGSKAWIARNAWATDT